MWFTHVHWSGTRFNCHAHIAKRHYLWLASIAIFPQRKIKIWQPRVMIMWGCYSPKHPNGLRGTYSSLKNNTPKIVNCSQAYVIYLRGFVSFHFINITHTGLDKKPMLMHNELYILKRSANIFKIAPKPCWQCSFFSGVNLRFLRSTPTFSCSLLIKYKGLTWMEFTTFGNKPLDENHDWRRHCSRAESTERGKLMSILWTYGSDCLEYNKIKVLKSHLSALKK